MTTWIHTKRKSAGLSQEEVCKMLGISRPTYNKLEKGTTKPTESQKDILSRVFGVSDKDIKTLSSDISDSNKEDIYMREIPKENVEKFQEILLYILTKVGSRPNIGQTALYKLLYFIDFDYYEKFEEQIIGATYIKNTYGPTPVSFAKIVRDMERKGKIVQIKSKHFNYDQVRYMPTAEANIKILSGQELKHIDEEIERLANMTAKQLSDLPHIDTPWRVAKEKEVLNYQYAFYRPEETSVREYEPL